MRNSTLTKTSVLLALGVLISGFPLNAGSAIAQQLEPVTVHTIVRTESDIAFKNIHDALGFNVFLHLRAPVAIDQQDVIRMNRDTIYSSALLDLSQPVFITMPETDGRYMNLQIISQDHYSYAVTQSGRHEINQDKVGTRYAGLVIRTFIDADDPEDIAKPNDDGSFTINFGDCGDRSNAGLPRKSLSVMTCPTGVSCQAWVKQPARGTRPRRSRPKRMRQ